MRKLFSFVLAALLLFSSVPAFAELDPIVGCWYIDVEMRDAPNIPDLAGLTRSIFVLVFEEDGTILRFSVDFKDNNILDPAMNGVVGKWEKSGDDYITKVFGIGEKPAYIREKKLISETVAPGAYLVAYKMITLDWYSEMMGE